MAYPSTALRILTELWVDGAWLDISDDVRNREIVKIVRGRANEGSRVDPSKLTLQLDNRAGTYSPRNPLSPLFGKIGTNTPIRVSVTEGERYLDLDGSAGGLATTPDHADLDITGDIDIRVEATIDWHDEVLNQALVGKWDGPGDQRSYTLRVDQHFLILNWTTGGTAASGLFAAVTLVNTPLPERAAVRVTLDVDNGTGDADAAFYWAESIDGPWEQIGDTLSVGTTTTIHSGTAPLTIGVSDTTTTPDRTPPPGAIHAVEVYDGIDGALVAAPDFTVQTVGEVSFVDDAGRTWTLTGTAAISQRKSRFVGEVADWATQTEVSGTDIWVHAQGAGIMRRLSQGRKPVPSTLRRRIPSGNPLAYWPMEEDADATQAYSPIDGVTPLVTSGLDFAADDSLAGSAALPTIGASSSIAGVVPASSTGEWHVEFVYFLDAMPGSLATMMEVTATGTVRTHRLRVQTNNVQLEGLDADGAQVYLSNTTGPEFTGTWNRLQISATPDGSDVDVKVRWITIGGGGLSNTETYTGTAGRVTGVGAAFGADLDGMSIGHLSVFAEAEPTTYADADEGFTGEAAHTRMARLCAEEDVQFQLHYPTTSQLVGPQRPGQLMALLREAAEADGGVLLERRDKAGLTYHAHESGYNRPVALTLDYTTPGHVPPGLRPRNDDQALRNDITVTRRGGSSARAVDETTRLSVLPPPDGVGRYDEEVTLNLSSDNQPPRIAGWRLHLGTWDEDRFSVVPVNVATAPGLLDDIVELDVGDRIQITGVPPTTHPDGLIDLIVRGYTESLSLTTWTLSLNCTPAGPWTIAVADGDAWADTDGSELAAPATTADTTMYVRAHTGPAWTTDPTDYPYKLRVGGEIVTATAAAAAGATPMTADGDASLAASTSHVAPSVTAEGTADLLVCAWIPWDNPGAYTIPASMTEQAQTTGTWSTFADATEPLTAAGATGTRTATRVTSDAWAAISVIASAAPAGTPVIEEHLDGVSGAGAQVTLTTSAATEAGWWLLALQGWDNNDPPATGGPSGAGWSLLAATSPVDASAPYIVAHARQVTQAGAQAVDFPPGAADDNQARLYVLSGVTDLTAQAVTVTRAVNNIVKAHAAGTDVRLAHPAIAALVAGGS